MTFYPVRGPAGTGGMTQAAASANAAAAASAASTHTYSLSARGAAGTGATTATLVTPEATVQVTMTLGVRAGEVAARVSRPTYEATQAVSAASTTQAMMAQRAAARAVAMEGTLTPTSTPVVYGRQMTDSGRLVVVTDSAAVISYGRDPRVAHHRPIQLTMLPRDHMGAGGGAGRGDAHGAVTEVRVVAAAATAVPSSQAAVSQARLQAATAARVAAAAAVSARGPAGTGGITRG